MTDVLFVCTGNTCRSPLAEALARSEAAKRGVSLTVGSAGTFAAAGEPASLAAIRAAGRRGVDLTSHRSRALTRELLEDVDLALAMSPAHLEAIRYLEPGIRTALVTEFLAAGDPRRGSSVPDPFGSAAERYEEVAEVLQSCVQGLIERVLEDW